MAGASLKLDEDAMRLMEDLVADLRKIAEDGTLPDGDHANCPTVIWAADHIRGLELAGIIEPD